MVGESCQISMLYHRALQLNVHTTAAAAYTLSKFCIFVVGAMAGTPYYDAWAATDDDIQMATAQPSPQPVPKPAPQPAPQPQQRPPYYDAWNAVAGDPVIAVATAPQIAARIASMNAAWNASSAGQAGYMATNLTTPTTTMAPPSGGWHGFGHATQQQPLIVNAAAVPAKAMPQRRWTTPPAPPSGPMPAAALMQSQPPGPPPPRRAPPTPITPEEAAALAERQRAADIEARRLEAELAETLARRRKQEVSAADNTSAASGQQDPAADVPWIFTQPADGSVGNAAKGSVAKAPPPPLPARQPGFAASSGGALSLGSPGDGGTSPAGTLSRGSPGDGGTGPAEADGPSPKGGRPKRPPPSGERTPLRCMKCGLVLALASAFLLLDCSPLTLVVAIGIAISLYYSRLCRRCCYHYQFLPPLPLSVSTTANSANHPYHLLPPLPLTLSRTCCISVRFPGQLSGGRGRELGGVALGPLLRLQ